MYSANCSCDNVTLDQGSDTKALPSCPDLSIQRLPPSQSWHGQMTAGVKSQQLSSTHSLGDPSPAHRIGLPGTQKKRLYMGLFSAPPPCFLIFKTIANMAEKSRPLTWVSSNLDKCAFFGIISGPMQWTTFCPPIKSWLFSVSHKNSMEMRKWNGIFDYRI